VEFPEEVLTKVENRLRRVEGQVRAIRRMLEDGRDCRDIVTQLSAASHALDQAGVQLIAAGMTWCIEHPREAEQEGMGVAEIERMFTKLA